jgi:hypothetical protein
LLQFSPMFIPASTPIPPINVTVGEMKRRDAYELDQINGFRYVSTLVIAAAIIATVRLAREDIGRPRPKILTAVSESVSLARSLLEAVLRRYPHSR